jgi:hypothetical protein
MKKLILSIAVAFSLSGCATMVGPALDAVVSISKPAASVGDKVVLEGTRGLILAHNAYQGAAALITVPVKAKKFNNDQLDMIAKLNDRALALLNGADATLSIAERAASIMLIANQLNSIRESVN